MTTLSANAATAEKIAEKDKLEKRRALGRGLESLLPGPRVVRPVSSGPAPSPAHTPVDAASAPGQPRPAVPAAPSAVPEAVLAAADGSASSVALLAIEAIDRNPFQTRHVEDDAKLAELADSIAASGVVQPILVRPAAEAGRYILVLGERRLHASKKAGQTTVPAMVRKLSDQQAAEMTIIENLQREDLSALEQAEAFRTLSTKFQLTQEEIGKRVGLSRVSVANYMRLLKLPREVLQLLTERKLSFSEARELLKLDDDAKIVEAAQFAVKKGLTLEQIERLVLAMSGLADPLPGMPGQEKKQPEARWIDPNVRAAQMELERMLGLRVKIRDRKGKGRIMIEYSTVDDYERVVAVLSGK
jgi:ParB family transcriptional regulator, chromosome partitioning protein